MNEILNATLRVIRHLLTEREALLENLARTQGRCSQMLDVCRAAARWEQAGKMHAERVRNGEDAHESALDLIKRGKELAREVRKLRKVELSTST